MRTVRASLQRLGWPVNDMSDRQITRELYRRWFAGQEDMNEEGPLAVVSARGILASMAAEGNLDALCWAEGDRVPAEEVADDEQSLFIRQEAELDLPFADRRRSKRRPARELVQWRTSNDDSVGATGWLVDRSAEGLAFIAQADQAPGAGTRIRPTIHSRSEDTLELGPATVVRTEPLSPDLTLVCAQLEELSPMG